MAVQYAAVGGDSLERSEQTTFEGYAESGKIWLYGNAQDLGW
jgi:hypothetical protein